MSIKSILVSQPKPENVKSPYFALADKYKLKIDFRSFIHVEGIDSQEFRKERIDNFPVKSWETFMLEDGEEEEEIQITIKKKK